MLLNLNIINLAVVKSLDLAPDKGMSVLTGETGAGKSILLTAIGLALGDRADSGFIRPDCKRAEINLEFDLSDAPLAKHWLQDNDLDDDQHCLIRRVINPDGRSKAYINNSPVTLQSLQILSKKLVEIHGQHAHLTLLNTDEQRRLLDEFGKHQTLLSQVNTVYRHWKNTHSELEQLVQSSKDQSAREELLHFQIGELQQLDLESFDYQGLSEEHTKQANLSFILDSGQKQLDILYENEQRSVYQMLGHCFNELSELGQLASEINDINDLLAEAQIQVEEASQQMRRFLEAQEIDPQRLEWMECQIGIIHALSRKHQVAAEDLPERLNQLTRELDSLTHSSTRIEELQALSEQQQTEYFRLAKQLSESRHQSGQKLQQDISALIKELGMPQGDFQVYISDLPAETPHFNGLNKIEFLISTNPGLPAKPLGKIASGGELSRISLAIQVTTSNDKTTPTMIFDEVDSGIGGGTAEIVGKRLRTLSHHRQVLCVTHLPQVASQAHQHLFVEKSNLDNMTSSTVKVLNWNERIEEVARMLGGINITENTLAHAQEMLESAGNPSE